MKILWLKEILLKKIPNISTVRQKYTSYIPNVTYFSSEDSKHVVLEISYLIKVNKSVTVSVDDNKSGAENFENINTKMW